MRFIVQIICELLCILCIALSVNAQPEPTATLSLNPDNGTFTVGEIFDVDILLNTGGYEIDGVDIRFLNYDPSILEVQDADPTMVGVQITPGTLMPRTQLNKVNPVAGTIDFGQITSGGSKFIGSGVLARVTFKVIGVGTTDLVFDFTLGNTRDTNVAGMGIDLLASATGAQFTSTATTQVIIDIKPGSDPNSINPKSKGVIPVAIITTDTFDATTVDPLSVKFGPNGAKEAHNRGHIEDVDGDGDDDMVLHFRTQETGIQCGDTEAELTGTTVDGQQVEGSDSIQTVGC
jgi:hypothetical protein